MSRIRYSDEEDFPGQFGLWQANCNRSISGQQGQSALRDLESALLALPAKRLIAGELDDGEDVCAIGALVRHRHVVLQADPEEMVEVGEECGMPRLMAWKIVEVNDMQFDYHYIGSQRIAFTPEERYAKMLAWVQKRLLVPQA